MISVGWCAAGTSHSGKNAYWIYLATLIPLNSSHWIRISSSWFSCCPHSTWRYGERRSSQNVRSNVQVECWGSSSLWSISGTWTSELTFYLICNTHIYTLIYVVWALLLISVFILLPQLRAAITSKRTRIQITVTLLSLSWLFDSLCRNLSRMYCFSDGFLRYFDTFFIRNFLSRSSVVLLPYNPHSTEMISRHLKLICFSVFKPWSRVMLWIFQIYLNMDTTLDLLHLPMIAGCLPKNIEHTSLKLHSSCNWNTPLRMVSMFR